MNVKDGSEEIGACLVTGKLHFGLHCKNFKGKSFWVLALVGIIQQMIND